MNVMYASDDNYAWLMGISMISLFENNRGSQEINVFLFGDNLSEENQSVMTSIANQYGRNCYHVDVAKINIPQILMSERYPKSTFSRLFAYDLLPDDVEKLIYLDCDTIVMGSLDEMFDMDVEGKAFLATKDCMGKAYKRKIGLKDSDTYINAGVMLMNIKRLREMPIAERIVAFVDKYADAMTYADQEIVNGIFQGDFGILPVEYDMQTQFVQYPYEEICRIRHPHRFYTKDEVEFGKAHPRIYHYTTCMLDVRPWFANSELVNTWAFDKYKEMSPWKDRKKQVKTFDGMANTVLRQVDKMPNGIRLLALGLIHSTLRPNFYILKNSISQMKKKLKGNDGATIGIES